MHRIVQLQTTSCPADVMASARNTLGQHEPGALLATRKPASPWTAALRRRDTTTVATNMKAPAPSRRLLHAWPSPVVMHELGLLALEQKRLKKLQTALKRRFGRSARRVFTHKVSLIARNRA